MSAAMFPSLAGLLPPGAQVKPRGRHLCGDGVTHPQSHSFAQGKEQNTGLCPPPVQGMVLTGLVFSTPGH